jgi:hypothetical protein
MAVKTPASDWYGTHNVQHFCVYADLTFFPQNVLEILFVFECLIVRRIKYMNTTCNLFQDGII